MSIDGNCTRSACRSGHRRPPASHVSPATPGAPLHYSGPTGPAHSARPHLLSYGSPAFVPVSSVDHTRIDAIGFPGTAGIQWHVSFTIPRIDLYDEDDPLPPELVLDPGQFSVATKVTPLRRLRPPPPRAGPGARRRGQGREADVLHPRPVRRGETRPQLHGRRVGGHLRRRRPRDRRHHAGGARERPRVPAHRHPPVRAEHDPDPHLRPACRGVRTHPHRGTPRRDRPGPRPRGLPAGDPHPPGVHRHPVRRAGLHPQDRHRVAHRHGSGRVR